MEKIPQFLIEMLEEQYGKDLSKEILEGYTAKRKVTIRVNSLKSSNEVVEQELKNAGIETRKVAWSDEAYIVENVTEKELQNLEIYKNGEIYLQSLSSMLPPIILNPQEKTDILDMAAAPGGKTTQIAALTNNKAHITACEMNKIRAEKLKYNIQKQGATSVYIMETDSRRISDFFSFDQILLDSPCSGSGTLNAEDSNIEKYFTKKLIDKCTKTQFELLKKAIKVLKPGKDMVYSTCSILSCENEEIVNRILNNGCEIIPIEFEGMEEIPQLPTKIKGTICVKPNELYEGFFVAKIRKIRSK
ncbi:MAG: RsmB/NOP family class I SAM-dependent RNA methyltransferase [Clostridia bacterium]|nr:RsmB/NOP family class I SAM-dependent RNA methyltransferase [Clostridia bacterium]